MIHVARRARPDTIAVLCDYAFLAPLAPFALAPAAPTITIMHDLVSSRVSDDAVEQLPPEVAGLTAEEEFRLLSLADAVVAIQPDEAEQVRARLPSVETIVAPHAVSAVPEAQPGDDDTLLFVGSNTASNRAGLEWFLERCWPQVRDARPRARLVVAGSVSRAFDRRVRGVRMLGVVPDLDALYRDAGLVVAPLRTGSGLKIKLVEALGAGKAVVGTPISAQGVAALVEGAMIVSDAPEAFAATVADLIGDRERRAVLGRAALACARAHFQPSVCYGALTALLERELAPASARWSRPTPAKDAQRAPTFRPAPQ